MHTYLKKINYVPVRPSSFEQNDTIKQFKYSSKSTSFIYWFALM